MLIKKKSKKKIIIRYATPKITRNKNNLYAVSSKMTTQDIPAHLQ